METQGSNVKEWMERAKGRGSIGFVDMCDTFSYDHYPVFFGGPSDDYETASHVEAKLDGKDMQKSYGVFTVEKS